MSLRQALVIGSIQLVALIPGTSRSASSIVGGLLVGLDRPTATAFSFYLAIPTLGGATLYALLKNLGPLLEDGSLPLLAVGVAVAFATALIAIRWLLRYVSHHDFRYFALYRVLVGVAILVDHPAVGHERTLAEPVRRLRRVDAAGASVESREVLTRRRLADTQLTGRGRDRAALDVGAEDLELAAGRALACRQDAFR